MPTTTKVRNQSTTIYPIILLIKIDFYFFDKAKKILKSFPNYSTKDVDTVIFKNNNTKNDLKTKAGIQV